MSRPGLVALAAAVLATSVLVPANAEAVIHSAVNTQETWQAVTTATKEKNYPLCGIAYELALTKFSAYPLTTSGEELTASNFLSFLLETKAAGGQLLIENHDYEALPKKLIKEAVGGVKLIGF